MRYSHRRSAKDGFTLVEVMIVILVIMVLLGVAIPSFLRARDTSRSKACVKTLRQMQTAKEQWALDKGAKADAIPAATDLVTEYMRGQEDTLPTCPAGGHYDLNNLASVPTCTIGNNATPDPYDDHVSE